MSWNTCKISGQNISHDPGTVQPVFYREQKGTVELAMAAVNPSLDLWTRTCPCCPFFRRQLDIPSHLISHLITSRLFFFVVHGWVSVGERAASDRRRTDATTAARADVREALKWPALWPNSKGRSQPAINARHKLHSSTAPRCPRVRQGAEATQGRTRAAVLLFHNGPGLVRQGPWGPVPLAKRGAA